MDTNRKSWNNNTTLQELIDGGCTVGEFARLISDQVKPAKDKQDLRDRVTNILREIGIPSHIKGFHFLREAIMIAYEKDYKWSGKYISELYETVANMHNTKAATVNRGMKNAIEGTWNCRGDDEVFAKYFGNTAPRYSATPTNSMFIATIVDWLREE